MARRYNKSDLANWINQQIQASHDATTKWREEAERNYRFVMGHQWAEEDLADLRVQRRPAITFNRIAPTVDVVYGMELQNRQRITYLPVEPSLNTPDPAKAELASNGAEFFRRKANAAFQESAAFRDVLICGVGVTVDRVDYERDPEGEYRKERFDPLMYYWDATSNQTNMDDTRWRAVVKLVLQDDLVAIFGKKVENANSVPMWHYWLGGGDNAPHDATNAWRYDPETPHQLMNMANYLPLVEFQWYEYETRYYAWLPNPLTGKTMKHDLTEAQYRELSDSADVPEFRSIRYKKRIYRRAFLVGSLILEDGEAPCPTEFTINPITGRYDRDYHSWVGLVRNMIGTLDTDGPQQMANKLYSEIVHIMSTNARGGLLAETDAFTNQIDAEEKWAASDSIIWMRPGGLNKIKEKELGQYPVGLDKLMTWAVSAVPEVTGVSWEMLGLANREQPNVLESNRKQSTATILADFFDSLRFYRITTGRVLLYFMAEIFAGESPEDSALIRVDSATGPQIIPLLKDQLANKYDIYVDESPSSPNVKEQVWGVLSTLMPHFQQMGMPVPPEVFDFLPLPASLANSWKKAAAPQPPPPEQQAQIQAQIEQMFADVAKTKAETQYKMSQAASEQQDMQLDKIKTQAEVAEKATQIMGGGFQSMFGAGEPGPEQEEGGTGE